MPLCERGLRLREAFGDRIPDVLYHGAGCRTCGGTGYLGRQGVFELMAVTDELRSLILQRAPAHELRKVATMQGMRSLREDGWRVVRDGRTTVEELMRNTKDEEHAQGRWGAIGDAAEAMTA